MLSREAQAWFEVGNDLVRAARFIWDERFAEHFAREGPRRKPFSLELVRPFFLLAGFGVESNLKGLRVRQMVKAGPPRTKADGSLVGALATHDLTKLAEVTGILGQLSHNERGLLQRLTIYTTWAGRYPVERPPRGSRADYAVMNIDRPDLDAVIRHIAAADQELRTIRVSRRASHSRR
jgi:hypothetical protein